VAKLTATDGDPLTLQTSIHGKALLWLNARARETVGAKAASSMAHTSHTLNLRS
jgi:hypothetical protein